MKNTMQYRICWRSGLTGATGHGTGTFPKEQAQQIADGLNSDKENKALHLYHWIAAVNTVAEKEAG